MEYNPPCWNCTRYGPGKGDPDICGSCDAFPKGIPEIIWHGLFDHESPLGGEKDGLLFEADDKRIGNPVRMPEKRLKRLQAKSQHRMAIHSLRFSLRA